MAYADRRTTARPQEWRAACASAPGRRPAACRRSTGVGPGRPRRPRRRRHRRRRRAAGTAAKGRRCSISPSTTRWSASERELSSALPSRPEEVVAGRRVGGLGLTGQPEDIRIDVGDGDVLGQCHIDHGCRARPTVTLRKPVPTLVRTSSPCPPPEFRAGRSRVHLIFPLATLVGVGSSDAEGAVARGVSGRRFPFRSEGLCAVSQIVVKRPPRALPPSSPRTSYASNRRRNSRVASRRAC